MTVGECVLCGKIKKCLPKDIEHQEYDLCALCWKPSNRSYKEKAGRAGAENGFGFRLCRSLA
jgi:hypothetical protein